MRFSILILFTSLAVAQPTLRFSHTESPEAQTEITQAVRSILGKETTVEELESGIIIRGSEASATVGEWLLRKLDGDSASGEIAFPGIDAESVAVYRLSLKRSPETMAQRIPLIKAATSISAVAFVDGCNTIALRGPDDKVKATEWLLSRLDKVSDSGPDFIALNERGRQYVMRVFYPRAAPDRDSPPGVMRALQTITDSPVVFSFHSPEATVWRGAAGRAELADWLFHELDAQPGDGGSKIHQWERLGDADDAIIRIFYLSKTESRQTLNELQSAIRTEARILRLQILYELHAIVLRGNDEQIAAAERAVTGWKTAPSAGTAQAPKAFDVFSLKRSVHPEMNPTLQIRPTVLDGHNLSLASLISSAYFLRGYQLSGPDWIKSETFDLAAKTSAAVSPEQLWTMVQGVLVDRFHLAVHREDKTLDGYELTVAKAGLKVHAVPQDPETVRPRAHTNRNLTLKQVTMAHLANAIGDLLGRPVEDATHVNGLFDIDLKWVPDAEQLSRGFGRAMNGDPTGPSLFDVVQEQLGLKLEKRKITTWMLVVDHADKVPVEN